MVCRWVGGWGKLFTNVQQRFNHYHTYVCIKFAVRVFRGIFESFLPHSIPKTTTPQNALQFSKALPYVKVQSWNCFCEFSIWYIGDWWCQV